jgi:hypothetical protein
MNFIALKMLTGFGRSISGSFSPLLFALFC